MELKQLTTWESLRRSMLMVVQAVPHELRNLAILKLVTGVGPSLSLYLSKVVIDEASRLLTQGVTENAIPVILSQPKLLWCMVAALLLNLMVDSVDSIGTTQFAALRDKIQGYLQEKVLDKVANFDDITLFETPDLLNLLELSNKGIFRLQRLAFILVASLTGLFIFIPSVGLSASIAWWVPLLLLACSIPSIIVEMHYHKKSWRVEETQASINREMDIFSKVLRGEVYAKEVRLFSLQSVLLDRWRGLFTQMIEGMQQIRREGTIAVIFCSIISRVGASLPYIYVVFGVLQGKYSLGDVALYTGIILQMQRSLYILIGNTGDIYDVVLATSPIFQLLDLEPQLKSGSEPIITAAQVCPSLQGIQLQDLSFSYPGSDKPILEDINLTIRPGEMVALVGENGAGKTTLAKLLCRLYDPKSGNISWHGQDFQSLDINQLRSRIGVVMQDYARFPATLRENVGWGYLPNIEDNYAIKDVLEDAGIDHVIIELSQGLETPLGKQLENGVDLSGGQWQRIAIARALMRLSDVELLVFDEPTAALNPKNEHEIYEILRKIAQGRMSVVVSHRLALAKMADRIVVLEHGKILEEGTHEELMAKGERYHTMFTRQASSYL
ncbi:MAG: ABC transporter ATP-binding protein [Nostocaceae cyanobacterium]|nr:ABC transporter ATP-binding protein [Nostocaceae cyanobacterium]